MAGIIGRDAPPRVRDLSGIKAPNEVIDFAGLAGLMDQLATPSADPYVHPRAYTNDTLTVISQIRSILDDATMDLVRAGHLNFGSTQRELADAGKLSTQTVNRWVRDPSYAPAHRRKGGQS